MLANITGNIVEILRGAGIEAGRAYPRTAIEREGGCFVRARIESVKQTAAGFAGYLGQEADAEGEMHEVYGLRCSMELALDIYASHEKDNAAEACEALIDDIIFALGGSAGVSIGYVSCGGISTDKATGLLICPCRAALEIILTLPSEDDNVRFSDFILKGDIKK